MQKQEPGPPKLVLQLYYNPFGSHDFSEKKKILLVDLLGCWQVTLLYIGLQQVYGQENTSALSKELSLSRKLK